MSRSSLTLSILLAASTLASAQTIQVGDQLPFDQIEGLTQTEARSFSDFYGRTVMLEFFAYWCGPCAAMVPHVNELQEKFGPRGFSAVGVTAEAPAKTEPWVKRTGGKYAYGYDTSNALHQGFQITSIPYAVLIDPFGTVVWTGHPQGLTEEKIEQALSGALERPSWQWPAEARPMFAALSKGEYAAALQKAMAVMPRDGLDAEGLVRGRITALVSRFEGHLERKDFSDAVRLGTRLEKELAGLPEGQALATRMSALRADPEVMREVEAAATLADLEARASTLRKATDARKVRDEVAAFLEKEPSKKYERRAQKLLEALDRALSKATKDS